MAILSTLRRSGRAAKAPTYLAYPANDGSAVDMDDAGDTSADEDDDHVSDEDDDSYLDEDEAEDDAEPEDDEDDYVDKKVDRQFLREYESAQQEIDALNLSSFVPQTRSQTRAQTARATRASASSQQAQVEDAAEILGNLTLTQDKKTKRSKPLTAKQKRELARQERELARVRQEDWKVRAEEEASQFENEGAFKLSWKRDIERWIADGAPQPLNPPPLKRTAAKATGTKGKGKGKKKSNSAQDTMPTPGYVSPSCGYSSNIVQDYNSPKEETFNFTFSGDYAAFKPLTDEQKIAVIRREAEVHGIERPKGYRVSFHYNPHVEYHHFGSSHPMKPWRLTLTKQLILAYGLEYAMDIHVPRPATFDELAKFHDRGYLDFLSKITPQNAQPEDKTYLDYGFGGDSNDCPVFDGLWNYVSIYSGASMNAAHNLINEQSEIAINWSGGLHHAKKGNASGFCYINDIVLAIQLLLTKHPRVLYIDIDVHHGDGVEAAFESTDRVFTLSYHKYGIDRNGYPFFPGTGNITDMGPSDPINRGKGHTLNIPIDDGIDDEQYQWLFKTVTGAVVDKYQPNVIVLQSGADSLGGDRLGRFNLNIKAHGYCVEVVKRYGVPVMLIGGGGYTPRNVARTWCHETAVCVGAKLHNDLPGHIPYLQAFQGEENGGGILYPDLHNTKRHENLNSAAKLQKLVAQALENLRYLENAPSVKCDTRGMTDERIMQLRQEVARQMAEEAEERETASSEATRRRRERNTGGRGERAMR